MTARKPDRPLPDSLVELMANAVPPTELGAAQRDRMRKRVLESARDAAPEGTETLRHSPTQWVEVAPFVEVREISRDDEAGTHVSLVRMRPGGVIEPHRHSKDEEFIVLEGDCQIGGHLLTVGDVHRAVAGSNHDTITTRAGVLVLIRGEFPYPSANERP